DARIERHAAVTLCLQRVVDGGQHVGVGDRERLDVVTRDEEDLEAAARRAQGRNVPNAGSQLASSESFRPFACRSAASLSWRSGCMREVGTHVVSAARVAPSALTTGTDAA